MTSRVRIERDDTAFWIGLDRPDRKNALDEATVADLHGALDDAAREACVIVIHSLVPTVFASGADLRELLDRRADDALRRINVDLFDRLEHHRWPTIAAVDGAALGGGCELACACDFRVCSPSSVFAQPETSLGILAGAGGNWRLSQLVGLQTARRMLLLGERLGADQALQAGLVDAVAEDPVAASRDMARTMGGRSWRAMELTKLALRSSSRPSTAFDVVAQALAFESTDKGDRITAFLNRRAAKPESS